MGATAFFFLSAQSMRRSVNAFDSRLIRRDLRCDGVVAKELMRLSVERAASREEIY